MCAVYLSKRHPEALSGEDRGSVLLKNSWSGCSWDGATYLSVVDQVHPFMAIVGGASSYSG